MPAAHHSPELSNGSARVLTRLPARAAAGLLLALVALGAIFVAPVQAQTTPTVTLVLAPATVAEKDDTTTTTMNETQPW